MRIISTAVSAIFLRVAPAHVSATAVTDGTDRENNHDEDHSNQQVDQPPASWGNTLGKWGSYALSFLPQADYDDDEEDDYDYSDDGLDNDNDGSDHDGDDFEYFDEGDEGDEGEEGEEGEDYEDDDDRSTFSSDDSHVSPPVVSKSKGVLGRVKGFYNKIVGGKGGDAVGLETGAAATSGAPHQKEEKTTMMGRFGKRVKSVFTGSTSSNALQTETGDVPANGSTGMGGKMSSFYNTHLRDLPKSKLLPWNWRMSANPSEPKRDGSIVVQERELTRHTGDEMIVL